MLGAYCVLNNMYLTVKMTIHNFKTYKTKVEDLDKVSHSIIASQVFKYMFFVTKKYVH